MVRCRLALATVGTAYTMVQALARGRSRLGAELRISYWVRAGETATTQLFEWPAASRLQTGLTLVAFLGRLKGMTGRRDAREITRDCERMCEIGQEIWAQDGRRVAGEGRARGRGGRVRAALEGLWRRMEGLTGRSARTRDMRALHERLREIGQKSLGRMTADGRLAKAARVVEAGGYGLGWRPFGGGWKGLTGVSACTRVR